MADNRENMRLLGELDQMQEQSLEALDKHLEQITALAFAAQAKPESELRLTARCLFFVGGLLFKRRAAIELLKQEGGSDGSGM